MKSNTKSNEKGKRVEILSKAKALSIIEQQDENFYAEFKKKDGTLRRMQCRMGVEYNLKGGTNKVMKPSNGYVTVFDVDKFAYRTLNVDTLKKLETKNVTYKVKS